MVTIYVLKCEQDKYYVGKTANIKQRLIQHSSGNGCGWTKKYPPIEAIEIIPDCDGFDEDKHTLINMDRYGIDNVRGGSWSRIILDPDEIEQIQRRIYNAQDRCFKCGKYGHFIGECLLKKEVLIQNLTCHPEYNGKNGVIDEWCETRMRWLVNLGLKSLYIKDDNLLKEPVFPEPYVERPVFPEPYVERPVFPEPYVERPVFPYGTCFRCGRESHYAQNCYAKKDITGKNIY